MVSSIRWCFLYFSINVGILNLYADLDWWQTTVIYQIYPRSFKDSNGDGDGDLKGIEEQMNYFVKTGIQTIWLSPIFRSPMMDNGYDISNYTEINPIFGTMDDFLSLVKSIKSMNMKIILDFVPNHTSNESEWFQKSIEKIEPYSDYYVWRDPQGWTNDGRTPIPPNNWVSAFSGSAWQYNPDRKQFYLHQFLNQQPDLNYRSKALIEEMKNVLRFWLDKGVDGFRLDAASFLVEDAHDRDEPKISNQTSNGELDYSSLNHIYTLYQPETFDILAQFREVLDSYSRKDGHTRLLVTEPSTPPDGNLTNVVKFYGNSTNPISQMPFNFLFIKLNFTSNANSINWTVNDWLHNMPSGQWPNWVAGNHDNPRITSRFTHEMIDGVNMMLLLLPGIAVTYNGDELGMEGAEIRWDQVQDTFAVLFGPEFYSTVNRDPERTPFQWDSSLNAGFSNSTVHTWLPVNPNYYYLNFKTQESNPRSNWNVYRSLVSLRTKDVFVYGNLSTYVVSEWIFAFTRAKADDETYVVVLNLNNEYENVNLSSAIPNLPPVLEVQVASVNSEYDVGTRLNSGCYVSINGSEVNVTNDSKGSDDSAPMKINSDSAGVTFIMRPQSALVLRTATGKEPDLPISGSSKIYPTIIFIYALIAFNFYLR